MTLVIFQFSFSFCFSFFPVCLLVGLGRLLDEMSSNGDDPAGYEEAEQSRAQDSRMHGGLVFLIRVVAVALLSGCVVFLEMLISRVALRLYGKEDQE